MSNMQSYIHSTRQTLNRLIGDVVVKSLFSGYGFYHDNHMFGIVQNGIFYLRAEGDLVKTIEKHGAFPCPYSKNNHALSLSRYYGLHADITDHEDLYRAVVLQSIAQVKQQKIHFQLSKKTRIKELCNLGIKHERLLIKVNINDVNQLRQIGAEMAYIRMKKIRIFGHIGFLLAFSWRATKYPGGTIVVRAQKTLFRKIEFIFASGGNASGEGVGTIPHTYKK